MSPWRSHEHGPTGAPIGQLDIGPRRAAFLDRGLWKPNQPTKIVSSNQGRKSRDLCYLRLSSLYSRAICWMSHPIGSPFVWVRAVPCFFLSQGTDLHTACQGPKRQRRRERAWFLTSSFCGPQTKIDENKQDRGTGQAFRRLTIGSPKSVL